MSGPGMRLRRFPRHTMSLVFKPHLHDNQAAFRVPKSFSKPMIKAYLEQLYGVKVRNVQTTIMDGQVFRKIKPRLEYWPGDHDADIIRSLQVNRGAAVRNSYKQHGYTRLNDWKRAVITFSGSWRAPAQFIAGASTDAGGSMQANAPRLKRASSSSSDAIAEDDSDVAVGATAASAAAAPATAASPAILDAPAGRRRPDAAAAAAAAAAPAAAKGGKGDSWFSSLFTPSS